MQANSGKQAHDSTEGMAHMSENMTLLAECAKAAGNRPLEHLIKKIPRKSRPENRKGARW